jgi:hypothetical protein
VSSSSHSIVPDEQLIAPLRAARRHATSSGFRNVYFCGRDEYGHAVYKARVKVGRVLSDLPGSRSTQPHVVALRVAEWYARTFGPNWQQVAKYRKCNAFMVRYSASLGGYTVRVWVLGRPEEVVELQRVRGRGDVWRVTEDRAVFGDRTSARRGMRLYLRRRYGLFATLVLYRETKPVRAA